MSFASVLKKQSKLYAEGKSPNADLPLDFELNDSGFVLQVNAMTDSERNEVQQMAIDMLAVNLKHRKKLEPIVSIVKTRKDADEHEHMFEILTAILGIVSKVHEKDIVWIVNQTAREMLAGMSNESDLANLIRTCLTERQQQRQALINKTDEGVLK